MGNGIVKSALWLIFAVFCFVVAALHAPAAAREAGVIFHQAFFVFPWRELLNDQLLNVVLLASVGVWGLSRVRDARRDAAKSKVTAEPMASVRAQIDVLDEQLVALLARRQQMIQTAAGIKWANGIPARVPERVEEVLQKVARRAEAVKLDVALSQSLWSGIIEWSIAYEERLMNDPSRHDPQEIDAGADVTGAKP